MADPTNDQILSDFASRIFDVMLKDIVLDSALQSHREILKSRAICDHCGTRCGSVHIPPSHASTSTASLPTLAGSRAASPAVQPLSSVNGTNSNNKPASTVGSGGGTPNGKDKEVYFECMQCNRQIASSRFAPHLASCLGIGTGSRRVMARNASSKSKADSTRSASPFIGAEGGTRAGSLQPTPLVSPSGSAQKSKGKGRNGTNDTESGATKRARSPGHANTPSKKSKKQKLTAPSAPLTQISPLHRSPAKKPSGLRESSTTSSFHESQSQMEGVSPVGSTHSSVAVTPTPSVTASTTSSSLNHQAGTVSPTLPSKAPTSATSVKKKLSRPPLGKPAARSLPGSSQGRAIAAARIQAEVEKLTERPGSAAIPS